MLTGSVASAEVLEATLLPPLNPTLTPKLNPTPNPDPLSIHPSIYLTLSLALRLLILLSLPLPLPLPLTPNPYLGQARLLELLLHEMSRYPGVVVLCCSSYDAYDAVTRHST